MKKIRWALAFGLLLSAVTVWVCRTEPDRTDPLREVPRPTGADREKFYRAWLGNEREQRVRDLEQYAKLGLFPHNHEVDGKRVPVFMDRHARLCAVAYLAACSLGGAEFDYEGFQRQLDASFVIDEGFGVVVAKPDPRRNMPERPECPERVRSLIVGVSRSNNQVRISDLRRGSLYDWIVRSGLTQEECALIQPTYRYLACDDCMRGSEARPKQLGDEWPDPVRRTEERDRKRLQAHFARVLRLLREQREASVTLATTRLVERLGQ